MLNRGTVYLADSAGGRGGAVTFITRTAWVLSINEHYSTVL